MKRKNSDGEKDLDEDIAALISINKNQKHIDLHHNHHQDHVESPAVGFEVSLSISSPHHRAFHGSPPPQPPPPPPPLPFEDLLPPVLFVPKLITTHNFFELPSSHPMLSSQSPNDNPTVVHLPPSNPNPTVHSPGSTSSRPPRAKRNPDNADEVQGRGGGRGAKSETIPAPFPWATDRRATVHSLAHLLGNGIHKVKGEVQCKKCEKSFTIEYDLHEKFSEVSTYISNNMSTMHHRAPHAWMYPTLPTCNFCGQENSCKPLIAEKKRAINWLFLLLGQLVGCCTLEQLKYFCKHTKNHRTGAKDRVLYLAYLALCRQLNPAGTFDA